MRGGHTGAGKMSEGDIQGKMQKAEKGKDALGDMSNRRIKRKREIYERRDRRRSV